MQHAVYQPTDAKAKALAQPTPEHTHLRRAGTGRLVQETSLVCMFVCSMYFFAQNRI